MKDLTKKQKKIKDKSKEIYEKNKEDFKKWYESDGKEWMKNYMSNYYKENKLSLTLYQKENRLKEKGYNQPMKNLVRDNIIKLIGNYDIKKILTLESEKFYFSKLLPEKKIIIFERYLETYNKMLKSKPKNVSLFLGDISGFRSIDMNVDFIYLDFCGTWENEKETINDLKEHIKNCKLFAVTLNLRDKTEKLGDHQFDLLKKIQDLTELNLRVIYGETYRDSTPMITILMENR